MSINDQNAVMIPQHPSENTGTFPTDDGRSTLLAAVIDNIVDEISVRVTELFKQAGLDLSGFDTRDFDRRDFGP